MPELPRDRPNLYIRDGGEGESFTSPLSPRTPPPPSRLRVAHANKLLSELNAALGAIRVRRGAEDPGAEGFVLEFAMPARETRFVQGLEDRGQGIELLSVSDRGLLGIRASVYVPMKARDYFLRKIERYRDKQTPKGKPKHEALVARIDGIALAALEAFYPEDATTLPSDESPVWWEIWLCSGQVPAFSAIAQRFELTLGGELLQFVERDVLMALGSRSSLGRCIVAAGDAGLVAEVRLARDTPSIFLGMRNDEQAEWVTSLGTRILPPQKNAAAVCILDSGVARLHALLEPALAELDVHRYDPNWPDGDSPSGSRRGHGTMMAGAALYGDLLPVLQGSSPVRLSHCLESVKMLPHDGSDHEPRLYGAVTRECVARPEVAQPLRKRVFCMAVTSNFEGHLGKPSSWSAAIDQLAYGDGDHERLFLLACGNVSRDAMTQTGYLEVNDLSLVQNPAQAWNAVAVGAYTEKSVISDVSFAGWTPIAPIGGLSPCSRTSVSWQRSWPIKPEIVMEGGNWAGMGDDVDSPDELGVLTTHFQPEIRQFSSFGETSSATAFAARLAAQILADRPAAWPETVRALLVHSAEWTPQMRESMQHARNKRAKGSLLRRFGYGVPRFDRAARSSANDVTIVAEESLVPLRLEGSAVKSGRMKLHRLPWPVSALDGIGTTDVRLRVTLSYFVEPNPGERGWQRRHRYSSHGLRFELKLRGETDTAFRSRINKAVKVEEEESDVPDGVGEDNWTLGTRIRDVGSLHSDIWVGSAAELAQRDALAVYPVGGWWKEKPKFERWSRKIRYSLCISLQALEATDIYTPISLALEVPTSVAVEL